MEKFGPYLRQLRRTSGLTLKKVESAAGVSNAYLSQIERGLRRAPHPEILKRLARVYEVSDQELLIAAGYMEDQAEKGVTRLHVENAYKHVLSDPRFRHGARLKGSTISLDAKRFIVDMYQKLTGQNLLGG